MYCSDWLYFYPLYRIQLYIYKINCDLKNRCKKKPLVKNCRYQDVRHTRTRMPAGDYRRWLIGRQRTSTQANIRDKLLIG